MAINVKPLGNRVLVQPLDEKEVKKGHHLYDAAKEALGKYGRSRRYCKLTLTVPTLTQTITRTKNSERAHFIAICISYSQRAYQRMEEK